jgi:hypothetical protein
MKKSLASNEDGQVELVLLLFPYLIIFVGLVLALSGSLGVGLVLMGFGTLLLGAGGRGSFGFGSVRITGPVGLLLLIIGIAIIYLMG